MPTFSPKPSDITRSWHVVDAEDLILGRLATEVARLLRGKHKPIYAPHVDTGDHVIVVNAAKVVMSAGKAEKLKIYRHSGYPGGLHAQTYANLLATRPDEAVRRAVRGMLPKGRLGRRTLAKLKVYAGPTHPHAAQKPEPYDLSAARRVLTRPRSPLPMPKPLAQTTGRRKAAVARVRLRPGEGKITVNRRAVEDYFPSATHRQVISEPLRLTTTAEAYDIDCTIHGGGIAGQAGALRLGIARALIDVDVELRAALKRAGLLTRDAREKESKKYGLKKARKAPQYSKR